MWQDAHVLVEGEGPDEILILLSGRKSFVFYPLSPMLYPPEGSFPSIVLRGHNLKRLFCVPFSYPQLSQHASWYCKSGQSKSCFNDNTVNSFSSSIIQVHGVLLEMLFQKFYCLFICFRLVPYNSDYTQILFYTSFWRLIYFFTFSSLWISFWFNR